MQLYEKSMIVDIIESKILDAYPQYYPQGQYNSMFIKYFYMYLRENTYSGSHSKLLQELLQLTKNNKTLTIKENVDKQTYMLTDDNGISGDVRQKLTAILANYTNYEYLINSENRIVIKVAFGWLPTNASCLLNLLTSENIINYYIDKNNTLIANTSNTPEYVCYRIDDVEAYDTILFIINNAITFDTDVSFKFATLLTQVEGSKGATLNRVVEVKSPESVIYEVGPYDETYLSTKEVALIVQMPYSYAISNGYYVLDVKNAVEIKTRNPADLNDSVNYFVPFSEYIEEVKFDTTEDSFRHNEDKNIERHSVEINRDSQYAVIYDDGKGNLLQMINNIVQQVGTVDYVTATFNIIPDSGSRPKPYHVSYKTIHEENFTKNTLDANSIEEILNEGIDKLDDTVIQYVLGDFIWQTADSKLIAYTQNLVSSLYSANILPNGVWSEDLDKYIIKFKQDNVGVSTLFYDGVLDKSTEEMMTTQYAKLFNRDFNTLFTEW